jgi:16S rRNA (guanine527-N7)-methyltransferase
MPPSPPPKPGAPTATAATTSTTAASAGPIETSLQLALRDVAAAGVPVTDEARAKLAAFIELFARWNGRINLSAARDLPAISAQVADSLYITPHLAGAAAALDVGSGGGLPVVMAAICWPALELTALEPVHKKHAFLRTAARELGLTNLRALPSRVEDHPRADYDVAMSRATFDLVEWIRLGLGRVRPGGTVLAMEGLRRGDLDPSWQRHEYTFENKQRAIVVARRPA